MQVKNGSKDLKRYPQISRRVRDTLARFDVHWSNVRVLQGECKAERYDKFMEDGAAGGAA